MYSCSDGPDFDPAPRPPHNMTTPTTETEPLGVTLGRLAAQWQKLQMNYRQFQMDYRRGYAEETQRLA